MGALLFAWPELAAMLLVGVILPALAAAVCLAGAVLSLAGWALERLELV